MAARSVQITLDNQTSQPLSLDGNPVVQHGKLTSAPPPVIPPMSVGTWAAESDGAFTGTQGSVIYTLQGNPQPVVVNWDNPFAGTSSYTMNYPFPGFTASINNGEESAGGVNGSVSITGGGNNANVVYVLTAE